MRVTTESGVDRQAGRHSPKTENKEIGQKTEQNTVLPVARVVSIKYHIPALRYYLYDVCYRTLLSLTKVKR